MARFILDIIHGNEDHRSTGNAAMHYFSYAIKDIRATIKSITQELGNQTAGGDVVI